MLGAVLAAFATCGVAGPCPLMGFLSTVSGLISTLKGLISTPKGLISTHATPICGLKSNGHHRIGGAGGVARRYLDKNDDRKQTTHTAGIRLPPIPFFAKNNK